MRKESYDFLKRIVETPSPSGFEQPVQRVVRKRMKPFADTITTDVHGNVVAALNPGGHPRVMLAGHCDQIGLMVKYIDDKGFIFFAAIGGIDPSVLPGTLVQVHTPARPGGRGDWAQAHPRAEAGGAGRQDRDPAISG